MSSDLPGVMKNEPEIFQMCAADIIWNQSLLNKDQARHSPGNKCVLSQVSCWLKAQTADRPDSGHSHRLFCFNSASVVFMQNHGPVCSESSDAGAPQNQLTV